MNGEEKAMWKLYFLISVLLSLATPQKPPAFEIITDGPDVYLTHGVRKFLLQENGQWRDDRFRLPDGRALSIDSGYYKAGSMTLLKDGKKQEQVALEANQSLDCITPLGDAFFAVLNVHSGYKSGRPIEGQHLVRIHLQPSLRIEKIRELSFIPGKSDYDSVRLPPRLFVLDKELLIYSVPDGADVHRKRGCLYRVAPNGKTLGLFRPLPTSMVPMGQVDRRWLLLAKYQEDSAYPAEHSMKLLDLKTKRIVALKNMEVGEISHSDGSRVAIRTGSNLSLYESPFSKPIEIPQPVHGPFYFWQDFVIVKSRVQDVERITIYHAKTGKELQTLSLPTSQSL
jgi:hypothetical protein